jgi:hypothetical protein
MANLFNLAVDYVNLYNELLNTADEETGELDMDISAKLDVIQGTFEEKAIATATVYRMLGNESDKIGSEIERLTKIKKRIDNEQDRVKQYLTQACEMTGTESLRGVYANISFRKSEQTVIDNPDILPKEFITEKVTYTPNKTAIKAAIKAGQDVTGAHIELMHNIQIK